MTKAILLYARVPKESMLTQGFYADEAAGLMGHIDCEYVRAVRYFRDVCSAPYDAMIGYFFSFASIAACIALLRGKRTILTGGAEQLRREFAPNLFSYLGRIILFYLGLLAAKKILAVSTSDYEQMRKLAFFCKRKIILSYHGVPAVEQDQLQSKTGEDRPAWSLVTICGLDSENNVRRKGMFETLQLLSDIVKHGNDAHLTIIGRDDRRDIIETEMTRLDLDGRVTITGYVTADEKYHLLSMNRFYVQLSHYEGFGIGAIEALAKGCIIIHSNVGGLHDTVGDYGIIASPNIITDLASAKPVPAMDLTEHMRAFTPAVRSQTIMKALFA